jgi:hypothetical protein
MCARICKICNLDEKDRKEVDRQLVQGKSKSIIARTYNVPVDSLNYHKAHHLTPRLVAAVESWEVRESKNILSELSQLMEETREILQEARAKEHNGLALKAIQQIRGNLSLLAAIENEIFKQQQSGLIDESELEQFRAWQAERANIGDQLKELSPEDLSIVRDVCIKKISRMNSIKEVEDFRSKSYYMQSYGPQDTETISPVTDATEQEIVGTTPLVRSDTASNGPDQDSNTDESEPSMRRTR